MLAELLDRDRRAIDEDARQLAAVGGETVLAEIDFVEVLAGGNDGEHDVDMREFGDLADDLSAFLRQRLGFGARAVPDRNVVARG